MTAADEPLPAQGEQTAYWLRRCRGVRVDSGGRRLGVVGSGSSRTRSPERSMIGRGALHVRTGILGPRLEAVSLEDRMSKRFTRGRNASGALSQGDRYPGNDLRAPAREETGAAAPRMKAVSKRPSPPGEKCDRSLSRPTLEPMILASQTGIGM
jgi:hypothetical protein